MLQLHYRNKYDLCLIGGLLSGMYGQTLCITGQSDNFPTDLLSNCTKGQIDTGGILSNSLIGDALNVT